MTSEDVEPIEAPTAAPTAEADADVDADVDADEVIVVTGTRSERPRSSSPVTTEVVGREQIEASGAVTVADALAQRPGLWIDRGVGGAGVTLQGLGPEYVLILVDGQRQIGRVDGALDLDRLGVGDVEQIEIVRGPTSALYGSDALGGVVNIIRRDPGRPEAEAMARYDSETGRQLRGRVAGGRRGWLGSLAGEWSTAPAFDRSPDTPGTTLSGYDDRRIAASAGHRRGEWLAIDAGAEYLLRDMNGVDAGERGVLDRRNLTEAASGRLRARLSGDRTIGRVSVGAGLFRDQFVADQRDAALLDQDQETRESLIDGGVHLERRLGDRHRVSVGAEALREALESDRLADGRGDRWRVSAYTQDEWRLGERYQVLVMPAARVDHDTQFGTHATPSLAMRWDPSDEVIVRASAGLGFRAPGFKELYLRFENPGVGYLVDGNPDLDPETSRSGQLGGEWRARSWLVLGASAYWNHADDLITAVTLPPDAMGGLRFSYDNIREARTRGGELSAALRFGRLTVDLGAALTDTHDFERDRYLEGVPRHRATGGVAWRDRALGFDASAEATVTGHRTYYAGDDDRAGTLTDRRVDVRARLAKTFDQRLTFFLGVDNLLDAGDDLHDRIAPLTLYVGGAARM